MSQVPDVKFTTPPLLVGTLPTTTLPGTVVDLQSGRPLAPGLPDRQGAAALILHPRCPVAYGVSMGPEGRLLIWERATDGLTPVANIPSLGAIPCHLAIDAKGEYLVVTNYGTGSLTVFRVDETGLVAEPCWLQTLHGRGPDPVRQHHSFTHHVAFLDEDTVVVNDLGGDALVTLGLDRATGALTLLATSPMPPGTGPRHTAFLSDTLVAISGELNGTVVLASLDRADFRLAVLDVAPSSLRPPRDGGGRNLPSDIAARDGLVYVANRGHDTVTALRAGNGRLTLLEEFDAGGRTPQHLYIDASVVAVACQDSDSVTIWPRQPNGSLNQAEYVHVTRPAWLLSSDRFSEIQHSASPRPDYELPN